MERQQPNYLQKGNKDNNQKLTQKKQVPQKPLKVLICQVNPFHKNPKNTIDRTERSLKMYNKQSKLDLIMFPQMSFVGYNFQSQQDAIKFAYQSDTMDGEQFQFVISLAKRLYCYVGFGYIEKVVDNQEKTVKLYNSVAIVNRQGKMHVNYRKTHLYYNDKFWAEQGSGFKCTTITNLNGQPFNCALAICMDINPKQFTSGEYQIANFMLQKKAQVLLMFTNWVDSSLQKITANQIKATYTYWLNRLYPLISNPKQRLILICDRIGTQYDVFAKKKTLFFGSSCGLMLNPTYMIKNLDAQSEGYLVIQTQMPINSQ